MYNVKQVKREESSLESNVGQEESRALREASSQNVNDGVGILFKLLQCVEQRPCKGYTDEDIQDREVKVLARGSSNGVALRRNPFGFGEEHEELRQQHQENDEGNLRKVRLKNGSYEGYLHNRLYERKNLLEVLKSSDCRDERDRDHVKQNGNCNNEVDHVLPDNSTEQLDLEILPDELARLRSFSDCPFINHLAV